MQRSSFSLLKGVGALAIAQPSFDRAPLFVPGFTVAGAGVLANG